MCIRDRPLQGLTQGAQPITSYNYGARNASRVRASFRALFAACMIYAGALWLAVMLFPHGFAALFSTDAELIDFTARALRVYMAVGVLFGVQLACQQTFIALGNAKSSLFLAVLRKIVLLIPLIYLLPAVLPMDLSLIHIYRAASCLAQAGQRQNSASPSPKRRRQKSHVIFSPPAASIDRSFTVYSRKAARVPVSPWGNAAPPSGLPRGARRSRLSPRLWHGVPWRGARFVV